METTPPDSALSLIEHRHTAKEMELISISFFAVSIRFGLAS